MYSHLHIQHPVRKCVVVESDTGFWMLDTVRANCVGPTVWLELCCCTVRDSTTHRASSSASSIQRPAASIQHFILDAESTKY